MASLGVVQDYEMPRLSEKWERLLFVQQYQQVKRATGEKDQSKIEGYAAMTLPELRKTLDSDSFTKLCDVIGD